MLRKIRTRLKNEEEEMQVGVAQSYV